MHIAIHVHAPTHMHILVHMHVQIYRYIEIHAHIDIYMYIYSQTDVAPPAMPARRTASKERFPRSSSPKLRTLSRGERDVTTPPPPTPPSPHPPTHPNPSPAKNTNTSGTHKRTKTENGRYKHTAEENATLLTPPTPPHRAAIDFVKL